jgi:crotonobetainyl-CoA:carnitine CoA-transferase CaiB-like acyl-CoA transferase
VPTAAKLEWIRDAYEAGQREIEVGSFVPARLLPQLADTAEVLAFAKTLPGLRASVLVPNLKGAERAIAEASARMMLVPLSASHAHSLANLRKTPDEVVAEIAACAPRAMPPARDAHRGRHQHRLRLHDPGPRRRGRSGAPGAGRARRRRRLREPGRHRGLRRPAHGQPPVRAVLRVAGDKLETAHFHDTRGLGLANCYAALQMGIARFDACLGGIGGCPHAPGASGNVATEDLAYMLASMGIETGLDFDALLALRGKLATWLKASNCTARCGAPACPRRCAASGGGGRMSDAKQRPQPLKGLRVIEFTHMVMGPTCGMVLADMGAEVIKVEPIDGDRTRHLLGAGAGFFPMFNRNKKSIGSTCTSRKAPRWRASCAPRRRGGRELQARHDGQVRPRLRLAQSPANPKLIYASCKGFLPGPYDHRTALDEVVQMMGGLAYMTGRPGDPLRAGTSVNDIMGGMFGAIGALGALIQRGITGRGMEVQSALFENNVFLVGQHMLQYAMTGKPAAPMPNARQPLGGVRRVHREGRRADLPGRGERRAVEDLLRRAGLRRPEGRPGLATNNPRAAAPAPAGHLRERLAAQRAGAGRHLRARRPAVRADPQARGPVRRRAPAGHRRAGRRAPARRRPRRRDASRPRCCPSPWPASAWACASIRRAGRAHRELLQSLGYTEADAQIDGTW